MTNNQDQWLAMVRCCTHAKTKIGLPTHMVKWRFIVFTFLVVACALGAAPELNDDSLEKMRDFIRPRAQEQKFLEIGWHESFFAAVNEARETNRPILLWTMNGHPLGCT